MKKHLLKTLLVAAGLCAGSMSAWAEGTLADDATAFTNGGTLTADTWYWMDAGATEYTIAAGTALANIVYTTDGTHATASASTDVTTNFSATQTLTLTRYYFMSTSEQTLTFTPTDYAGLTIETYDFAAANPSSSTGCSNGGAITVDGSALQILKNTTMDFKDRFAGGTKSGGVGSWYVLRNSGGLQEGSGNASKNFAILNLTAGDYVTINYSNNGATIIFTGDNNITGLANETQVISGNTYRIATTGSLLIKGARSSSNYPTFKSIVIATSTPVLEAPSFVFNSMVENSGLYYPKVTLSSTDDGVTYNATFNSSSVDVTSGYTFTETGTLTVYTSKAGRTNSAKSTYTVSNGWILANSVNANSLVGTVNYSDGTTLANNASVANTTWVIPGLTFGTGFTYRYSNSIRQEQGDRALTCTVLNENRIATYKHYSYTANATIYDYLTSLNNSATFKRSGTNNDSFYQYDLYVNPSEEVSVTIGATGYSTFSSPVPLDFSGVSGLTAYVAKSVAGGHVTLSSVTTAPANTGLVLAGEAGETYSIPVTASAEAPASNLLVGCIVNTTVAADSTSKFNNYVLVNEGGTAKFQSLVEYGATITGGKAFLKNGAYSVGAPVLKIVFADQEETGIETVQVSEPEANGYYNLAGQRVAKATKGLYIVNGKKVIMK